jgi:cytochrome c
MNGKRARVALWALLASVALIGCGDAGEAGDAGNDAEPADQPASVAPGSDLTPEQLENGIGPVREVELGELDAALAARGEDRFQTMCYACHRLGERYVAPKLGDVLERRTPEYVMNMILNPVEMTTRHPDARALLAEFMTQMPNQGLTEEDARAIVEYIRSEAMQGEVGEADPDDQPEG